MKASRSFPAAGATSARAWRPVQGRLGHFARLETIGAAVAASEGAPRGG